eukprot:TRINITY_DN16759_c0_g1_i1.p4 TRINITY_DN16759_c0_g1~~TRINITY_DN16759_c0_g1_i1.p4  ORF type:complete len:136 (+),score=2.56 TRINITY_DN16759_c0_g1_i1:644-1051(+)
MGDGGSCIGGVHRFFRTLGSYPVPFLSPTIAISSLMESLTTPSALFELVKADLLMQWDQQMQGRIITPRVPVVIPDAYGAVRIEAYAVHDRTITAVTHDRSQGLRYHEYDLEDGSDRYRVLRTAPYACLHAGQGS